MNLECSIISKLMTSMINLNTFSEIAETATYFLSYEKCTKYKFFLIKNMMSPREKQKIHDVEMNVFMFLSFSFTYTCNES